MKYLLLVFAVCLLSKVTYSQDLTDEKNIHLLNGIKYISRNKNEAKFSAVLKNNWLLDIKFNVVVNGEYNGSYSFLNVTNNLLQKNDTEYNYRFLLSHLADFFYTLHISPDEQLKIKAVLNKNHSKFSKDVTLPIEFSKDYDEAYISFSNHGDVMICNFFFRRLL